jgi:hypothetical protein
MRVPKTWVPLISKKIVDDLFAKDLIVSDLSATVLASEAEKVIMGELMVEDRLNDEVREILKKYSADIEKGRLDYRKVFDLTKKKIVEERGLIL